MRRAGHDPNGTYMVGYSKTARTRYHKELGFTGWARCASLSMNARFPADHEDWLTAEAPHLSRCPKCWSS
jgi:hypothetical protein